LFQKHPSHARRIYTLRHDGSQLSSLSTATGSVGIPATGSRPYGGFLSHGSTPQSSILVGFSIFNHSFGGSPIYGNPHIKDRTLQSPQQYVGSWNCMFFFPPGKVPGKTIVQQPEWFSMIEQYHDQQSLGYNWQGLIVKTCWKWSFETSSGCSRS
jgi:hypothetical protein